MPKPRVSDLVGVRWWTVLVVVLFVALLLVFVNVTHVGVIW